MKLLPFMDTAEQILDSKLSAISHNIVIMLHLLETCM